MNATSSASTHVWELYCKFWTLPYHTWQSVATSSWEKFSLGLSLFSVIIMFGLSFSNCKERKYNENFGLFKIIYSEYLSTMNEIGVI